MKKILQSVCMLVCLLFPITVFAQQTDARILGSVTDTTNIGIPGVTVAITSDSSGFTRTVQTNTDGTFTITNLAPNPYTVVFTLDGFSTITKHLVLRAGQTERTAVQLGVALSETVTVTGTVPVVDLSSAKLGVNVSPDEIEHLPVNGRNFANLMTLAPGATSDGNGGWASVRFNGKSNQQNYLNYDGVDGTYVWDASPGYLSATGSQFRLQTSMESVAEFRVNSGLAPAESGLGTGGNITVISKSGSNMFNGSVFEYGRDDALDTANRYDHIKQPLSLHQFGASLGGPLWKNHSFFFVSGEWLRQTTGLTFTEAVPSDAARAEILATQPTLQPLVLGFPHGTAPTSNPLIAFATVNSTATQREGAYAGRVDHKLTNSTTVYARYFYSNGDVDTPDRTVTPRRVRATQQPQNVMINAQTVRASTVYEWKVGINTPHTSAYAYGPTDYSPVGVSLSGAFTSSSIDARGTTGIARSGLLIRGSSATATMGSQFLPQSMSIAHTITHSGRAHTVKFGGEYRRLRGDFQYLGSTEISYNSITDFMANRVNSVAVSKDSPVFSPRQFYVIGFAQDTWQPFSRVSVEFGTRYEFYSVVREALNRAKPFFIEENAFGSDPTKFYNPDYNNIAPRLSVSVQVSPTTVVRGGAGYFYGPGQFEDRIQPIENTIERLRVTASDVPFLSYPFDLSQLRETNVIRGYTRNRPDEYSIQYGANLSRELPGAVNFTIGYVGSHGRDMFLRGVSNTLSQTSRLRPIPNYGQIDYKTSGCVDGLIVDGVALHGCGYATYHAVQTSFTRRFRRGVSGSVQYQWSRNRGTTQGSNEASTAQNTFDYTTEYGVNPQDIPHTINASVTYGLGKWRVGGIVNGRSGVPINVTINRPDNITRNGITVVNIPGGNTRGTQRPDLVPGVDPYLKDGVRWLNPAAFTTPQPGTFGNLPRNMLRGPSFWQIDTTVARTIGAIELRADVFNVLNRLNYENPAANLPNGTPGIPFTDSSAGTFGYMLGPLNRTVGQGTARQIQLSLRYSF